MSVQLLEGPDGDCVMYCSTSMWAFGPVMESREEATAFIRYIEECAPWPALKGLNKDPRVYTDNELERVYTTFKADERHRHEEWLDIMVQCD